MALQSLLTQAAELMVLGMGTVFILLTVMIGLINGTSRILARLAPEEIPLPSGGAKTPAGNVDDSELIAVIQAAIHRFRAGS